MPMTPAQKEKDKAAEELFQIIAAHCQNRADCPTPAYGWCDCEFEAECQECGVKFTDKGEPLWQQFSWNGHTSCPEHYVSFWERHFARKHR